MGGAACFEARASPELLSMRDVKLEERGLRSKEREISLFSCLSPRF